jgi:hypothetical protein
VLVGSSALVGSSGGSGSGRGVAEQAKANAPTDIDKTVAITMRFMIPLSMGSWLRPVMAQLDRKVKAERRFTMRWYGSRFEGLAYTPGKLRAIKWFAYETDPVVEHAVMDDDIIGVTRGE